MADFTVFTDIDTFLQSANNAVARTNLGLGTAATTASTAYATSTQGTTADSSLQPAAINTTVQGYSANLAAWSGIDVAILDDVVFTKTAAEPTGSDQVFNVVSLTQAEYDAGTPVATTFYIITA
tara:strand:- start:84 stop:455 length:372 start_codon:yes stop_codon:yes gene_type:complete